MSIFSASDDLMSIFSASDDLMSIFSTSGDLMSIFSASDDLMKTACKQVKNVRGQKKIKNISEVNRLIDCLIN